MLPTPQEFRALSRLAVPVVVVQLGLMLMGVVDTVMVGRLSAEALGAVALGNLFFFTAAVIGWGTLMALDPVVAQAVGARDEPAIARGLQRGIILAGVVAIPTMLALLPVAPALRAMGQPAELIPAASRYIYIIIPGVLPFYLFIAFRQTLQALERIAPIVQAIVVANLLNGLLNWAFIYGNLGAPAMGVAGAALATTLSRFVLAGAVLYTGWDALGPRLRPWRPESLEPRALRRMIRIGLPIGAHMFFEYGVFALVGALMGRIGTLAVGGHQIALNLSAIVFMVPRGSARRPRSWSVRRSGPRISRWPAARLWAQCCWAADSWPERRSSSSSFQGNSRDCTPPIPGWWPSPGRSSSWADSSRCSTGSRRSASASCGASATPALRLPSAWWGTG